jgi:hypothetical protein
VLIYEPKAHGGLWRMGIIALCGNAAVSLRSHLSRIAYPPLPLPEPYGRLFAPFRHHGKVMKVFLQLFVLLQGENDRDPVPVLIDNVTGSALNVANLLISLWCAGTIHLRSLRRAEKVLICTMLERVTDHGSPFVSLATGRSP